MLVTVIVNLQPTPCAAFASQLRLDKLRVSSRCLLKSSAQPTHWRLGGTTCSSISPVSHGGGNGTLFEPPCIDGSQLRHSRIVS